MICLFPNKKSNGIDYFEDYKNIFVSLGLSIFWTIKSLIYFSSNRKSKTIYCFYCYEIIDILIIHLTIGSWFLPRFSTSFILFIYYLFIFHTPLYHRPIVTVPLLWSKAFIYLFIFHFALYWQEATIDP